MRLRLPCAVAVAAALVGCGEQAVDPNPYGLSGVSAEGGQATPGDLDGGPGAPGPGGQLPKGYPVKKDAPGAPAVAADAPAPAAEPAAGEPEGLTQEEKDEINKLPAEEREQALAQVVCLISGEHLGSMGMPVKVEHDGKTAYLCCKGCLEDFQKDPAAALAKLPKK